MNTIVLFFCSCVLLCGPLTLYDAFLLSSIAAAALMTAVGITSLLIVILTCIITALAICVMDRFLVFLLLLP